MHEIKIWNQNLKKLMKLIQYCETLLKEGNMIHFEEFDDEILSDDDFQANDLM